MTTEMKPLEWHRRTIEVHMAISKDHHQCYLVLPNGLAIPIKALGPYDGTIETAKKRCEEHRRKSIPPIGFDASFNGVPFNWDTREGGENP